MKKLVSTLAVCVCLAVPTISASAESTEIQKNNRANLEFIGISTEPPAGSILSENKKLEGKINPLRLDEPNKSDVVDLNKKQMDFSGKANGIMLYTNNHFTGKSTVAYSITNSSSYDLTVKIYEYDAWSATQTLTVNKNSTSTGNIAGLDSSKLYYMSFSAPSDFAGYVK
ncbi:TPA: hypothetical protein ACGGHE_004797 [Bacillus pseudomycoides]